MVRGYDGPGGPAMVEVGTESRGRYSEPALWTPEVGLGGRSSCEQKCVPSSGTTLRTGASRCGAVCYVAGRGGMIGSEHVTTVIRRLDDWATGDAGAGPLSSEAQSFGLSAPGLRQLVRLDHWALRVHRYVVRRSGLAGGGDAMRSKGSLCFGTERATVCVTDLSLSLRTVDRGLLVCAGTGRRPPLPQGRGRRRSYFLYVSRRPSKSRCMRVLIISTAVPAINALFQRLRRLLRPHDDSVLARALAERTRWVKHRPRPAKNRRLRA